MNSFLHWIVYVLWPLYFQIWKRIVSAETIWGNTETFIPVVVGISREFGLLKVKSCWLYHENLLFQNFNDMYTQVFTYFFSASVQALRGRDLKNVCKRYFTPLCSAICRNTLLLMTADFFFMIWWIVLLLSNIPQIQILKSTYSHEKNESYVWSKSQRDIAIFPNYTISDSN